MARGRPKKVDDRFEESRKLNTLDSIDRRFEDSNFNAEGLRRDFNMKPRGILDVNENLIPDDVVYMWGTESILGMSDNAALIEYARAGWTPVPYERHPEFWIDERIDAGATKRAGIIRVKGAVLLQKSKALCDIDTKRANEENIRALDMANRMEKPNGLMPIGMNPQLKSHSLTVSRNRSFN